MKVTRKMVFTKAIVLLGCIFLVTAKRDERLAEHSYEDAGIEIVEPPTIVGFGGFKQPPITGGSNEIEPIGVSSERDELYWMDGAMIASTLEPPWIKEYESPPSLRPTGSDEIELVSTLRSQSPARRIEKFEYRFSSNLPQTRNYNAPTRLDNNDFSQEVDAHTPQRRKPPRPSRTPYEKHDYCHTECGAKHLACNLKSYWGEACPIGTGVINLRHYQDLIVQLHNDLRNKVAQGATGLPPASHLSEVRWDAELAYLAEIYASKCQLHFKTCYTTDRFPTMGRNSAKYTTSQLKSMEELISGRIQSWFDQLENVQHKYIQHYPVEHLERPISSVLVALNERSNRIGCAAVQWDEHLRNTFIFVCFYSYSNIHQMPVYEMGKAASKCKSGRSKKYKYLCGAREPIYYK